MSHGMQGPHLHRPTNDIFRGDPFKIQSYKFRYADRPVYPVQHYQRPEPQPLPSRPQQFETFYRNPKFSSDPEHAPATPSASWTPQNTTPFVENRRRKFLRDFQSVLTAPSRRTFSGAGQPEGVQHQRSVSMVPQPRRPIEVTNSPLLQTCCNRDDYQTIVRGQSATSLLRNCSTNVLRPDAPRSASMATFDKREREWKQSVVNRTSSNIQLLPKRSACSGCEININIGSLDSESEADNNLRIKIETDTCLLNNTDRAKQTERHQRSSSASRSTQTFGIDKRLSKFCVADNKARRSSEQDAQQRERELELKMERERARQRERVRENLRQQERQRDNERLLELEVEREKDRLRELERESQRRKEYHEYQEYQVYQEYQEQLRWEQEQEQQKRQEVPMRAMPISPVMMTSHLYRRTSNDRLPGMVHFCDRPPAAASKRAKRLQSCSKNLTSLRGLKKTTAPVETAPPLAPLAPTFTTTPPTVRPPRSLERTSSGTSNGNVYVTVSTNGSSSSLRRPSATVLSEQKQLNGSAGTHAPNTPILTRLNNIPIRITTSRPGDRDLEFSMNQVRLRNNSPMPGVAPRLSTSRMRQGTTDDCSSVHSLNVNINVYADTTSRRMRM
ncbi:stress response protein NST1 [Drosophila obscura]|uniref:stress response protein NST1 n=1 Tax=Drosophila obscura TaxID=7282 RepID=UPI001BB1590B|nr:stress response protein NST1 [Drosophila obscura]